MDFVVASLLKSVSSLSNAEAISIMLEAHSEGKAVVITCHLEHAELYLMESMVKWLSRTSTLSRRHCYCEGAGGEQYARFSHLRSD